jgi:hypothetical protein
MQLHAAIYSGDLFALVYTHLKVLLCHLDCVHISGLVLVELEHHLGPVLLQLVEAILHLLLLLGPVHNLTNLLLKLVQLQCQKVIQLESWISNIKRNLQAAVAASTERCSAVVQHNLDPAWRKSVPPETASISMQHVLQAKSNLSCISCRALPWLPP